MIWLTEVHRLEDEGFLNWRAEEPDGVLHCEDGHTEDVWADTALQSVEQDNPLTCYLNDQQQTRVGLLPVHAHLGILHGGEDESEGWDENHKEWGHGVVLSCQARPGLLQQIPQECSAVTNQIVQVIITDDNNLVTTLSFRLLQRQNFLSLSPALLWFCQQCLPLSECCRSQCSGRTWEHSKAPSPAHQCPSIQSLASSPSHRLQLRPTLILIINQRTSKPRPPSGMWNFPERYISSTEAKFSGF